jgi:hypothetical protein
MRNSSMIKITLCLITLSLSILFDYDASHAEEIERTDKIHLITDAMTPYIFIDKNDKLTGPIIDIVESAFIGNHIEHIIRVEPWKRAIQAHANNPDWLIFPLSRTKSRESNYEWIAPLHNLDIYLYGLRDKINPKEVNITDPKYSFACTENSIYCEVLFALGINKSSIMILAGGSDVQFIKLVRRGRIDFYLATPYSKEYFLNLMKLDKDLLVPLNQYKYTFTEYIAANKGASERITNKVKRAFEMK